MRKRRDQCPTCGVPWQDHMGIEGTCKKLKIAREALKVICKWACCYGGKMLDPKHTEKLCRETLEQTDPKPKS